ncbi:MAG: carbon storage regulator [Polyangiaceae bacterium]
MLIVQRRVGERITIGDGIEVTIQSTTRGGVRLAIVAPRGVTVLRGEVRDAIARANAEALAQDETDTTEQSEKQEVEPAVLAGS